MTFDPRIHDPDYPDPIVEEIREIKRKLAAKYDYDIGRMMDDVRRQEEASGRTYVSCPPRSDDPTPLPPLDTTTDNAPTQQPTE